MGLDNTNGPYSDSELDPNQNLQDESDKAIERVKSYWSEKRFDLVLE